MEQHYTNRTNWLRAAVLGANDGIISTTSLVIGVAAASTTRSPVVLAAIAGLVAGACSMAAGEYVSVSSQSDVEEGDLERERLSLETLPDIELEELSEMYAQRGVSKELAIQIAIQLTAHNALEAHAKEELGINEITKPNPLQAALVSALSFVSGGILPLLVVFIAPLSNMVLYQYGFAILFLAISGAITAQLGGCRIWKPILRICIWGTIAMCTTALVGYIFGVQTG